MRARIEEKRRELLEARASGMRSALNGAEAALWREVSGSKLGVAFRRQVVVGEIIADFMAPAVKLIVEVDGRCHASRKRLDVRRDERLRRLGYRVVRISAQRVISEPARAVALILEALAECADS